MLREIFVENGAHVYGFLVKSNPLERHIPVCLHMWVPPSGSLMNKRIEVNRPQFSWFFLFFSELKYVSMIDLNRGYNITWGCGKFVPGYIMLVRPREKKILFFFLLEFLKKFFPIPCLKILAEYFPKIFLQKITKISQNFGVLGVIFWNHRLKKNCPTDWPYLAGPSARKTGFLFAFLWP